MAYAIIANWDAQMRVSRYNYVETEAEAIAIVDKLRGVGPEALPPAKQAPKAYYAMMPPAPAGTALFQHRARFWVADPGNGTMTFDAAACHAWQSKVASRAIDAEADRRVDRVLSPDAPARAERVRFEMPESSEKAALMSRIQTLRTAAQTLKDSLTAMTPEKILGADFTNDVHWSEEM